MPSTFSDLVKEIRDVIYPYIQEKYDFFSANKTNFDKIEANIESIKNAKSNADDSKTFRDQAEEFKNQTASISSGDVLSQNVKFLDNKSLETYRNEIKTSIDSINTLLSNDNIDLQLQKLVAHTKQNKIGMEENLATIGNMIWKQNLLANNLKIEGVA